MYHCDLSVAESEVVSRDLRLSAVYVGWLAAPHPYRQGEVSTEFIEALRDVCRYPIGKYLGYHVCDFCGATPMIEVRPSKFSLKEREDEVEPRSVLLGSIDIEVVGKETVYYAPGLILHYVEKHNYWPPQEFMDAVLTRNRRRIHSVEKHSYLSPQEFMDAVLALDDKQEEAANGVCRKTGVDFKEDDLQVSGTETRVME